MKGLLRSAGVGAVAAVVGLLLLGRSPAGATVQGATECRGEVDVVVTVNDCGAGEQDAVVLGRWRGRCGAFAVDVATVGPGIGYVCAYQRRGGRVVAAARQRGSDEVRLRLVGVRR